MTKVFTALLVVLLSMVKFVLMPPLAIMEYKMGVIETVCYTTAGGVIGVLVFYFLSKEILVAWTFLRHRFRQKHKRKAAPRASMNRRRTIVKYKNRMGLAGLIIFTPCVISIPLGTFLAAKFFPSWKTVTWLCLSVLAWSVALSLLFTYMANLLPLPC